LNIQTPLLEKKSKVCKCHAEDVEDSTTAAEIPILPEIQEYKLEEANIA